MFAHLIDGAWCHAEQSRNNVNPSNSSDVIGAYAEGGKAEVDQAVAAAKRAQPQWAASTPQQRFDVLDFIGGEIIKEKEQLGRQLAREEGKTLPEAIGEVNRAGQIFKFFAGEALRQNGTMVDSIRPGVTIEVTREALGIVGLITPWNFPIAIPAWKIAPALAYGNAAILKPAELSPASAWSLAEIIDRSALPKGVFQMVMGAGTEAGAALVAHPDVAAISFTGSVQTGRLIASTCAGRMAKFQLEMGGKNPLVVLDDADLDQAVATAVNGAFFSTGQRCTASSRLIVTQGIHDRFVTALLKALPGLTVGDALDPTTKIGPMINEAQLQRAMAFIEKGQAEGARLLYGGKRLELAQEGYFLEPTLFGDTHNEMIINQEEIFGPVATIIKVADYQEALFVANDTPYGLSSGICTSSLASAHHFKAHAKAGMVMVNLPTAGVDYHVPFGGCKASSFGSREQGSLAAEFYTTVKTTYLSY